MNEIWSLNQVVYAQTRIRLREWDQKKFHEILRYKPIIYFRSEDQT